MRLDWHNYKYYPYERALGLREAEAVLGGAAREVEGGVELNSTTIGDAAERLVYFSEIHNRRTSRKTVQARLENAATAGRTRQATRYSVHGLHGYKGKFNPQVAKAILNIFGVRRGDHVLDPFCGSGTTLIEAVQLGAAATGFDINPLAVYLANAKLQALRTPVAELTSAFSALAKYLKRQQRGEVSIAWDVRGLYLRDWFDEPILNLVESVRLETERLCGEHAPVFLAIASDLLRDYSQQDPNDLRIRRRKDTPPEKSFATALTERVGAFIEKLTAAQHVLGSDLLHGAATLLDVTLADDATIGVKFDAAITSPPYAMALPYIDTQRLSLVWLGLADPAKLLQLEATLIGSRETRGTTKQSLLHSMQTNAAGLPDEQWLLCCKLRNSLSASDGFRRQAVPTLLYRYFTNMYRSFEAVSARIKRNAPYGLIVGHNHTVLGGVRFDFDTPQHLGALANAAGWSTDEAIKLQTYQRYGYHAGNAVAAETLLILRNR